MGLPPSARTATHTATRVATRGDAALPCRPDLLGEWPNRQRQLSQQDSSADRHHGRCRPPGHHTWQRPPLGAVVYEPATPPTDIDSELALLASRVPAQPLLLLRVQNVCDRLSLSRSTVHRLLTNGTLPSVAVGRTRRVTMSQLEQFVDDLAAGRVSVEPRRPGRKAAAR